MLLLMPDPQWTPVCVRFQETMRHTGGGKPELTNPCTGLAQLIGNPNISSRTNFTGGDP